jgi:hypothetical protein
MSHATDNGKPRSNTFLSREELNELTGVSTRPAQISWLEENRYSYAISRSGRPVVLRGYLQGRLGLHDAPREGPESQPDFSNFEPKS